MLPSTPTTTLSVPTTASNSLPPLPYHHLLPPPRFPCSCSHSLCPCQRSTLCVLLPQPLSPSSQPCLPFHRQPSPLSHSDPSRTLSRRLAASDPPTSPSRTPYRPLGSPSALPSPSLANLPPLPLLPLLSSPSCAPCWTPDPSSPSPSSSHHLGPPPLLLLPCTCHVGHSGRHLPPL